MTRSVHSCIVPSIRHPSYCQDRAFASSGIVTVLAVADGLGNSEYPRAEEGAQVAIDAVANWSSSTEFRESSPYDLAELAFQAIEFSGTKFEEYGNHDPAQLSELSTTLAVAVISGTNMAVATVGDAFCFVIDGSSMLMLIPPSTSNVTSALHQWRQDLIVRSAFIFDPVVVLLSTDGLEDDFETRKYMDPNDCEVPHRGIDNPAPWMKRMITNYADKADVSALDVLWEDVARSTKKDDIGVALAAW